VERWEVLAWKSVSVERGQWKKTEYPDRLSKQLEQKDAD
jgi:hypothetical protein